MAADRRGQADAPTLQMIRAGVARLADLRGFDPTYVAEEVYLAMRAERQVSYARSQSCSHRSIRDILTRLASAPNLDEGVAMLLGPGDTVRALSQRILDDPMINKDYKDAIGVKASDESVRRVGAVLKLRDKWEALKAEAAALLKSEFALAQIEEADLAMHMAFDDRIERVTADEKIL